MKWLYVVWGLSIGLCVCALGGYMQKSEWKVEVVQGRIPMVFKYELKSGRVFRSVGGSTFVEVQMPDDQSAASR